MNIKEKLYEINNLELGKCKSISEDREVYAVCLEEGRGIAIKTDNPNVVINESFNRLVIKNINLSYSPEGDGAKFIFLCSKEEHLSEKYALICSNFISLENRDIIKNNPLQWFNEWATLLGNLKNEKTIYDIIGEMSVLIKLFNRNETPHWDSTTRGTYDIQTEKAVYEVKSSILKEQTKVDISSRFQLETKNLTKPLNLVFCRVEMNDDGVSIGDLLNKLIVLGYPEDELKSYLRSNGYYEGKEEYYTKFIIHEIRIYEVDENFPKITECSFKDDKFPAHITAYQYTVDLDGLEYTKFEEDK